ncbi:unnamed protein product [Effrenium voratum]|nr:unnamed protein product [Effrenium voratum]
MLSDVLLDVVAPGEEEDMFRRIREERQFDTLCVVLSSSPDESLTLTVPGDVVRHCGAARLRIVGQAQPQQLISNPRVFAAPEVDVQIEHVTRSEGPYLLASVPPLLTGIAQGVVVKATGNGLIFGATSLCTGSGVCAGLAVGTLGLVSGAGAVALAATLVWHGAGAWLSELREI